MEASAEAAAMVGPVVDWAVVGLAPGTLEGAGAVVVEETASARSAGTVPKAVVAREGVPTASAGTVGGWRARH